MPTPITRKQSLWLGVGLLALFFAVSALLIARQSSRRIPWSGSQLTKEGVEGPLTTPTADVTAAPIAPQLSLGDAASAMQPADATLAAQAMGPGFVLNEFHRSLVRDGRTVWEIFGKKGRYSPGNSSAEIDTPRLTLTNKEGDSVLVNAVRAVLTLAGSELEKADLFDNVVLVYKSDTTMRTSRATYLKTSNTVEIPVHVEIENETMVVTGNKMHANLETREFILEDGVTSVIKPQAKSGGTGDQGSGAVSHSDGASEGK